MEINLITTFDDSGVLSELEKLERTLEGADAASDSLGLSLSKAMKEGADAAQVAEKSIGRMADANADAAGKIDSAAKAQGRWSAQLKETVSGLQVGGKSLAEWRDGLNQAAQGANSAAVGTGKLSLSQKALNLVMKANPILLVVSALSALIGLLSKSQKALDLVSRVTASFNAIVDVAVRRVTEFASGLASFASGDFSKGFDQITGSVSGLASELATTAVSAYNLEQRMQSFRDGVLAGAAALSEQKGRLEELKFLAEDESRRLGDRVKTLKEAEKLNEDIFAKEVVVARARLGYAAEQLERNREDLDLRTAYSEAEIGLQDLEKDGNKNRLEFAKQRREINQQAADERKKEAEERKKEADELAKELRAFAKLRQDILDEGAVSAGEDEAQKAFAKLEIELRKLGEKEAEARETAQKLGQAFDLAPAFEALRLELQKEFAAILEDIEKELSEPVEVALDNAIPGEIKGEVELKLGVNLSENTQEKSLLEKFNDFKKRILEGLGITDAEAAQIFGALGGALQNAADGFDTLRQSQIEYQDRILDSIDESISATEDRLADEQDLRDKGLANDVAVEEKKLADLNKLREDAEKKRLKLERQAATQQLLSDSARQVSNLITGATEIVKAESSKGLLGIIFAIGAIGTMFGIIAQARANARRFAEVPKFRTGTKVKGKTHEQGGEFFFDKEANPYELEKDEWIIGTAHSREHDPFLKRMNEGEFVGVDLDSLTKRNRIGSKASDIEALASETKALEQRRHESIVRDTVREVGAQIVGAIEAIPEISPLSGYKRRQKRGGVVREEKY